MKQLNNSNFKTKNYSEQQINQLALTLKNQFNWRDFDQLSVGLYHRTNNITKKAFYNFYSVPVEYDDLDLIKYKILMQSIETYNADSSFNFSQIYCSLLRFRILDYLKSFLTLGYKTLNLADSIEGSAYDYLLDSSKTFSPEAQTSMSNLKDIIKNSSLTPLEYEIFTLKYKGYKDNEISQQYQINSKKVENLFFSAKKKLKHTLKIWI